MNDYGLLGLHSYCPLYIPSESGRPTLVPLQLRPISQPAFVMPSVGLSVLNSIILCVTSNGSMAFFFFLSLETLSRL